jgi:phosphoribosyl-ATP pyrophosphohydrolase/phosphoribosyl-AMP cyclohydrolase
MSDASDIFTVSADCLGKLKFGADGLIPAVVQEHGTGFVLTVAYMNRESLKITLREGRTCFWSRSRKELWRKGETSGNTQRVVRVVADCDFDALVVEVVKKGPACHFGTDSCFHNVVFESSEPNEPSDPCDPSDPSESSEPSDPMPVTLRDLHTLLKSRKDEMPEGSYTSYLFEKGVEKILKKIGEESAEVVIGAMKGDKGETVRELADLCYHSLVLMCEMGIEPSDIEEELGRRHADKEGQREAHGVESQETHEKASRETLN